MRGLSVRIFTYAMLRGCDNPASKYKNNNGVGIVSIPTKKNLFDNKNNGY